MFQKDSQGFQEYFEAFQWLRGSFIKASGKLQRGSKVIQCNSRGLGVFRIVLWCIIGVQGASGT